MRSAPSYGRRTRVSVGVTLTLPAQPTTGSVDYVPLGGDGWSSPQSMYLVDSKSTGDVSGGINTIDILRDQRFEQLIDFVMIQTDGGAVTYRMDIFRRAQSRAIRIGASNAEASISSALWSPPAVIDPDSWRVTIPNVDTEILTFKSTIYNFRITASEHVPLAILLASIRRASSVV